MHEKNALSGRERRVKPLRPLLIIKTGSTFPALARKRGDFEDWIVAGLGLAPGQCIIANVEKGTALPEPATVGSVIITGSHAMVTEQRDWSEKTAVWLKKAVLLQIPVLGICFGHQLLAHAFGGTVGDNPEGLEAGTVDIILDRGSSENDPLFSGLPGSFKAQACHRQTVVALPDGAVSLASSSQDRYQAFALNSCAWGVQFHPEFDREIAETYLAQCRDLPGGQKSGQGKQSCHATPLAATLLNRFAALHGHGAR